MCIPFLKSSIGKKAVMAVTGLLFAGFVVAHMLGNLQIFLGQEPLNAYAKKLQGMPLLLWPARVSLLLIFVVHMWVSIKLAIENKKARPVAYASQNTVQASLASRTMMLSGMVIFAFVAYHLLHFTFGATNPEFFHLVDAKGRHDVYSMSVLSFRHVGISASYIFAMFVLCLHLSHGLASFPQSLGLNNEKCLPALKVFANTVALLIFIGNSSIPLAVIFNVIKLPGGA
ncbi:MAG: succinate dehydrogenase cytochrome b subunit [Candidatus Omnitrophota bacterium]